MHSIADSHKPVRFVLVVYLFAAQMDFAGAGKDSGYIPDRDFAGLVCAGSSWSGGSMGTVARPVAGVSLGHGKYDDSGDDYDRNRHAVGNPTRKGEKS